jgi:hypothetical protein
MSDGDDMPSVLTENGDEAEALRRMLEYAQLIAGELKLTTAERLIGAALLSLNDAREAPPADAATDRLTPDQIH